MKVIDGHHRYYGAIEATKAGADIIRLECKDFVGNEADPDRLHGHQKPGNLTAS